MLKRKSIKQDLIIAIFSLVIAILVAVHLASFFNTRHKIKESFDANLIKSAKLMFGLMEHEVGEEKDLNFLSNDIDPQLQKKLFHHYEYEIHSLIWKGNYLVYKSNDIQKLAIPQSEGFSNIMIHNKKWRGFSFYDPKSDIRILVLEEYKVRNELIYDILLSLLMPLLLAFLPLFLVIGNIVNRKLKPLDQLAKQIEEMSAQTIKKLPDSNLCVELKPFINAFNALMARLIKSIESERNFTNYAAHELKTPLATLSVEAHLLITNKDKTKQEEYAQNFLHSLNRINHLVSQLLTLARLDSDNFNIEKEPFNLLKISKEIIHNNMDKLAKRKLRIHFECDLKEDDLVINANKTYIEIMLGNLIDNAIKYSTQNSDITISISKQAHKLKFNISNIGEEIFPSQINKIFNNFYRINRLSAKENNNSGCGLGLAIAKKIADIHLAKIAFHSKNNFHQVELLFSY